MEFEGLMGYGSIFPVNQLGNLKILWVLRGYGFWGIWVRREAHCNNLGVRGAGERIDYIKIMKSSWSSGSRRFKRKLLEYVLIAKWLQHVCKGGNSRTVSPVWVESSTTSKDLRPNSLHGRIGPLAVIDRRKPKKLSIVISLSNRGSWFIFWHGLSKVKIRDQSMAHQASSFKVCRCILFGKPPLWVVVAYPFLWCSGLVAMKSGRRIRNTWTRSRGGRKGRWSWRISERIPWEIAHRRCFLLILVVLAHDIWQLDG